MRQRRASNDKDEAEPQLPMSADAAYASMIFASAMTVARRT